jgi:hypothetical protein
MRKWTIGLITLTLALVVTAIAVAHEGHDHKVMGTISSIAGNNLMVKTTDGKTMMVMLDAKSKITRGKTTVAASELKVGDRIVATGPEEKEMVTAKTVQIGAAPAPKATPAAPATKAPRKPL